jgi:hypothetical protein
LRTWTTSQRCVLCIQTIRMWLTMNEFVGLVTTYVVLAIYVMIVAIGVAVYIKMRIDISNGYTAELKRQDEKQERFEEISNAMLSGGRE